MRSFFLTFLLILFLGAKLDAQSLKPSENKPKAFPQVKLPPLRDDSPDTINFQKGRKLIIAFSPTDCGVCLEMLTTVDSMHVHNKTRIPVIGIIDTPYRQAANKIQKHLALTIPIMFDSLGVIKKTFSKEHSRPLLVLLNNGGVEKIARVGYPDEAGEVRAIIQALRKPEN